MAYCTTTSRGIRMFPPELAAILREWRREHECRRQGTHLSDRQLATCAKCFDEIRWVRTENGKMMPLEVVPDATGRFVFTRWKDAGGRRVVHYLKDNELEEGQVRYSSHYTFCPRPEKEQLPEREAFL